MMRRIGLGALFTVIAMGSPALAAAPAAPVSAAPGSASPASAPYIRTEVMIPMRDGVRLQTVILTPPGPHGPLPILLRRTPYGVPQDGQLPEALRALAADGYVFVVQNIRGRFKSEGSFSLAEDMRVEPGRGTPETRDAWDTVDWLVKHVPDTNGRVGIYGVSYDGYTAAATLLDPHPALRAVSEQASPVDEWMNDDEHRYGALRLSYAFEYAVLEEAEKGANTHFAFDSWDTYDWYLRAGPLSTLSGVLGGKIESWNQVARHPDYDAVWQGQAWAKALDHTTVPTLNVAGFWDQEDPWGPWQIFERAAQSDPNHVNLLVAGPWAHGAWRRSASTLGPIALGQDTARTFRDTIEAPFFAYWLHGEGLRPAWTVKTFQTGSNTWKNYASWPPADAQPLSLYLHADGVLSFTAPGEAERGTHRDYVSDPANPVPYRPRPISPTYPGGDWPDWESGDQRFVDHRPDVASFVSAPLNADLTVSGEVAAEIFASTSGTDADVVVKLIDVSPEGAQTPPWDPEAGPKPGAYATSANGYQLPIAMEVRRGRYLGDPAHPRPLTPGQPTLWRVPLRARDHVFLKGHRIMVQVQSSWFPLIDRNPQTFVANIFDAKASDFVSAMQVLYTSPEHASRIILPVVASSIPR
jgi:putative CocE/NonD family hydrolase